MWRTLVACRIATHSDARRNHGGAWGRDPMERSRRTDSFYLVLCAGSLWEMWR
jgi:hypothetical protein